MEDANSNLSIIVSILGKFGIAVPPILEAITLVLETWAFVLTMIKVAGTLGRFSYVAGAMAGSLATIGMFGASAGMAIIPVGSIIGGALCITAALLAIKELHIKLLLLEMETDMIGSFVQE